MVDDLMTWNIRPQRVTERMAAITEDAWSIPGEGVQEPPEKG
jgi:hypothetical protein